MPSSNSAKPKDITGSLVHYKQKAPRPEGLNAPAKASRVKSSLEREVAFDPLTFAMWGAVAVLISCQWVLMIGLSFF